MGIVHGDLKRENILVEGVEAVEEQPPSVRIRIIDFGLAFDPETPSVTKVSTKNLPENFAPECRIQDNDKGVQLTKENDVFALGRVFRSILEFMDDNPRSEELRNLSMWM